MCIRALTTVVIQQQKQQQKREDGQTYVLSSPTALVSEP